MQIGSVLKKLIDATQYITCVAANGCRAKQLVLSLHGRSANARNMLELAAIIQEENPCTEILIPHGVMKVHEYIGVISADTRVVTEKIDCP